MELPKISPSGKLRLTNTTPHTYVVPVLPSLDWFHRISLGPGQTLVVPEAVVYFLQRVPETARPGTIEDALRMRLIVVTGAPA